MVSIDRSCLKLFTLRFQQRPINWYHFFSTHLVSHWSIPGQYLLRSYHKYCTFSLNIVHMLKMYILFRILKYICYCGEEGGGWVLFSHVFSILEELAPVFEYYFLGLHTTPPPLNCLFPLSFILFLFFIYIYITY